MFYTRHFLELPNILACVYNKEAIMQWENISRESFSSVSA